MRASVICAASSNRIGTSSNSCRKKSCLSGSRSHWKIGSNSMPMWYSSDQKLPKVCKTLKLMSDPEKSVPTVNGRPPSLPFKACNMSTKELRLRGGMARCHFAVASPIGDMNMAGWLSVSWLVAFAVELSVPWRVVAGISVSWRVVSGLSAATSVRQ